ncbi:4a-hydroxytetrahydrobiopterin dehydratase [Thiospirillum jenense]|uniref:Putative pterin-4-alpha-carbinolamine dehydratase n=1 Tax=Thiospirillum jenense TaxID=1653858 RepID=A0A839HNX2_9GAMM|nr:4a-hydroxytetrahydrobiopterin dehydratase [Thiospirillum jenense]MBB1127002.1 4a-hydroxytetrahydrobiopterin dehydratase [Thiospirillum jenense]
MNQSSLTAPDIAAALAQLNATAMVPWQVIENKLCKTFVFTDFNAAFGFIAQVGLAAEALNHHPDWCNTYNRVSVALQTHEVNAISAQDFALAHRLEQCVTQSGLMS